MGPAQHRGQRLRRGVPHGLLRRAPRAPGALCDDAACEVVAQRLDERARQALVDPAASGGVEGGEQHDGHGRRLGGVDAEVGDEGRGQNLRELGAALRARVLDHRRSPQRAQPRRAVPERVEERGDRAAQRLVPGQAGVEPGDRVVDALPLGAQQRQHDRVAIGEVPVDDGLRDSGLAREPLHRERLDAAGTQQALRMLEELLAPRVARQARCVALPSSSGARGTAVLVGHGDAAARPLPRAARVRPRPRSSRRVGCMA